VLVLHHGYGDLSRIKQYPPLRALEAEGEVSPRLQRVCSYAMRIMLQNQAIPIIVKILELCPNVRNLAIWLPHGDTRPVIDFFNHRPISRLSLDLGLFCVAPSTSTSPESEPATPWYLDGTTLTESTFDPRIFDTLQHVTHLDMINISGTLWATKCHYLARLPRLTHVGIKAYDPRDVIQPILSMCPRLKMLIVVDADLGFYGEGNESRPSYMQDPRLVVLDSAPDPLLEWWDSAKDNDGFKDFWMLGEEVLSKQLVNCHA